MPEFTEVKTVLEAETANYTVLANVLDGVREFGIAEHSNHDSDLVGVILSNFRVGARRSFEDDPKRLLRVAWQTELAASVAESVPDLELKRIATLTLPVQVYYSLFNALRSLSSVRGAPISGHSAMLKDFALNQVNKLPLPWGYSIHNDPRDLDSVSFVPRLHTAPYKFNPLERSHPADAHLAYALLIAHRWKYDRAVHKWKRDNRKRDGGKYINLPRGVPQQIADSLRQSTLLDLLYELRVRVNYESADAFSSDSSEATVTRLYDGLIYLLRSGLLLIEAQIAIYVGPDEYRVAVDDWVRRTGRAGTWATKPLQERADTIKRLVS